MGLCLKMASSTPDVCNVMLMILFTACFEVLFMHYMSDELVQLLQQHSLKSNQILKINTFL